MTFLLELLVSVLIVLGGLFALIGSVGMVKLPDLLTRLHGLDELVGPVDTQSVYVTIANPLHP